MPDCEGLPGEEGMPGEEGLPGEEGWAADSFSEIIQNRQKKRPAEK